MADTPEHLRLFANLALEDAAYWRGQATEHPARATEYLAKADQRQDDARFYLEKADRDEAWNATEDYMEAAE